MAVDYVEDPYVHIVRITVDLTAVGNFVVKTFDAELYRGNPHDTVEQSRAWTQWAETEDIWGSFYSNSGSSSALIKTTPTDPGKPVWVVSAGRHGKPPDPPYARVRDGAVILYSENGGANWEIVYEVYLQFSYTDEFGSNSNINDQVYPTGIVWDEDEKAFYASFYVRDRWVVTHPSASTTVERGELIVKSPDGRQWTQVSRNMRFSSDIEDNPDLYVSDLNPYCKKPENQNRSGGSQKIPDGLQGYNAATKIFIKPTALIGFDPYRGARYSTAQVPSITRIDDNTALTTIKPVSVVDCYAVAFHDNTWIAVGGDPGTTNKPNPGPSGYEIGGTYIDVSFDDGEGWASVYQNLTTYRGATVSGQKKPDTGGGGGSDL